MEFPERLRAARKQLDYTQQQVAEQLGITKSTYCGYETGKREPDVEKIKLLSQILHVTGSYLIGLNDESNLYSKKSAPALSTEALRLAKDYEKLDSWGRKQVRSVADNELERSEHDARFFQETSIKPEEKVINIFTNPAAAGPALGETGQDCEPYTLTADDPQGAEYGVRVQGDSMEPYFPDGSVAFVNHDEMRDGDIGVFCVDSATVIKQWHYDRMMGITYLFSLNRRRADCDVVIMPSSGRNLVWQGRVITREHYPVPGL